MTSEILLVLGIVLVAVVLFASEKLRVDVIAMLVLLVLIITGLVTPDQAFSGFSNAAVITVWAVYIVSGGLFRTGVADYLGEQIVKRAGTSEPKLIAAIMVTCGTMSAFMNNIGATAVLMPAVIGISRQAGIPASRMLIPLAFSSLLGGNMTLIGTPPNILAASILESSGLESFGFFDFLPTGIVIFITGIVYMALFGRHLLPAREATNDQPTRHIRTYVCEFLVPKESRLVDQSMFEARLGADYDLTVMSILRGNESLETIDRETKLRIGDIVMIEGAAEKLLLARQKLGLVLASEEQRVEMMELESDGAQIVEATIAPGSNIDGQSVSNIRFRDRFGFTVMAVGRHGEVRTERLRDLKLRFGDSLLLRGPQHRWPALQQSGDFLVLEPVVLRLQRREKAPLSVAIMALVLILATLGSNIPDNAVWPAWLVNALSLGDPIMPAGMLRFFDSMSIATAMVLGAMLMVLVGCLTMDEAYQSIEWKSVFLIAGMLPLGIAMEQTGAARYLAELLVVVLGDFGPLALLGGIYLLAALLTQPMSNAAATVLIVPIAIDIALSLNLAPQPFVLATVIGASTAFLTPVGHQANVLVYGPGGYRFSDYFRVGGLLSLILMIVTMLVLPLFWPLVP